jgi:hypothetical protein
MPTLTRRRSPHHRDECWHVYYRDVHAGTIAKRTGVPQAKASIVKGYDPDGVAQTEIDHFGNCPVCRTWIDMRNLGQFCAHSRRGNRGHRKCGAAARRAGAVSDDLKDLRPTQVAARVAFACGITALVAISVYYGILWLAGRP